MANHRLNAAPPFPGLPAELRYQIYRLVLIEPRDIEISNTTIPQTPGLLAVNRQIRSETRTIYYQNNNFYSWLVNYDASILVKWAQSSEDRAASKSQCQPTGQVSWVNLFAWIKATYEGKTGGRYPRSVYFGGPDFVVGVFQIVMRMKAEEKSWEEIEKYLDDIHQIFAALSQSWDWVKSTKSAS